MLDEAKFVWRAVGLAVAALPLFLFLFLFFWGGRKRDRRGLTDKIQLLDKILFHTLTVRLPAREKELVWSAVEVCACLR